jgi:hypothetical protein
MSRSALVEWREGLHQVWRREERRSAEPLGLQLDGNHKLSKSNAAFQTMTDKKTAFLPL